MIEVKNAKVNKTFEKHQNRRGVFCLGGSGLQAVGDARPLLTCADGDSLRGREFFVILRYG